MPITSIGKDLYQIPHASDEIIKVGGTYTTVAPASYIPKPSFYPHIIAH